MIEQPNLFTAPPSHRADPPTSRLAAERAAPGAKALRERILIHLLHQGEIGATAFECWQACGGARPTSAGTRLGELRAPKDGPALVEPTGRTRPTDTGSPAVVWIATLAGRSYAARLLRGAA